MFLYPGFTFSFVTFPLLISSHNADFLHTIILSIALVLLIVLFSIINHNLSFPRGPISRKKSNTTADQLCRKFTFAEIRAATRNFSDSFVIGKGGFGKVFKGIIDNGATTVAIKQLDPMSKQGSKEFSTEIEMLSRFRHSHVVSLIGYCDKNDEMILVYEYVENGSLADHLYKEKVINNKNSNMSWIRRVKICIGAARGLDYLHTGTGVLHRVIHCDVKSSNILLDENWTAKISDFGLSKIGLANQSCTHVSTCVKGTLGYCDPEYLLTRRLTRKSDIYSFGVVLFEVLCGRPAFDYRLPREQISLVPWAQHYIQEDKIHLLIDPNLKWEIFENSLKAFVKIAGQCLHSRPKKRPIMSGIVASLEVALALQESKDSSELDEYIFDFGETFDNQEAVGSATVPSDISYTDSSSPTILMPLSHYPSTGQSEEMGKTSLGEDSLREDTLGGSASETFSNIKANMRYEEQINDIILQPPTLDVSFAFEAGAIVHAWRGIRSRTTLADGSTDTLGASASDSLSNVMANMRYEEQINDITLHPPMLDNSFAFEDGAAGAMVHVSRGVRSRTMLAPRSTDTLGSTSETLSNITTNIRYEERINDITLHPPTLDDSFAFEDGEAGPVVHAWRGIQSQTTLAPRSTSTLGGSASETLSRWRQTYRS